MRTSLTITPEAKAYLCQSAPSESSVLAVSLNNKGCNGHSYQLDWIEPDAVAAHDESFSVDGMNVAVRASSIMRLLGTTIDLQHDIVGVKLVWNNPQAVNSCGCGSSVGFEPCT